MAEQKYHGSCHCGAVHYDVTLDLEQPVLLCNCSICSRSGTMLTFVPTEQFHLNKGDGNLTSYKFNKQVIDHLFCKTCGIKSFAFGVGRDGKPMAAVNARCLEGVDVTKLKVHHYDGKAV